MAEVCIIVVNYGNPERTIRFVKEECPKIGISYKVVVADNGPNDASKALKEGLEGFATVIPTGGNVGFAKANIAGAQAAGPADYLLFVNNDIVFTDSDVVDKLIKVLEKHPNAGLIGPKILGLDGKDQSPEPFQSFAQRHILPYWGKFSKNRHKWDNREYSAKAGAGWHYRIMGSFLLMRADDYKACGGFDPETFLYSEESILSERLKAIGKRVWYEPSVKVLHEHAATTERYFDKVRVRRMKLESDIYYYRKYREVTTAEIALARFTLWLKERLGR